MKEDKDSVAAAEADAAAAAIAVARTEAHESVEYEGEEAGGTGMLMDTSGTSDTKTARERRAMLQKAVMEYGVGGWQKTVRCHVGLVLWCVVHFP